MGTCVSGIGDDASWDVVGLDVVDAVNWDAVEGVVLAESWVILNMLYGLAEVRRFMGVLLCGGCGSEGGGVACGSS